MTKRDNEIMEYKHKVLCYILSIILLKQKAAIVSISPIALLLPFLVAQINLATQR
jgi:hypothetical protein